MQITKEMIKVLEYDLKDILVEDIQPVNWMLRDEQSNWNILKSPTECEKESEH